MWRFLNNIPRALRQYIHSPRPSAGIHNVDEDVSEKEAEKLGNPSPVQQDRKCVQCAGEKGWANKIQGNFAQLWSSRRGTQHEESKGDEGRNGRACQHDFWKHLQGSHKMLEAFTVGTAMAWVGEPNVQKRHRVHLLYRMFFAFTQERTGIQAIRELSGPTAHGSQRPEPVTDSSAQLCGQSQKGAAAAEKKTDPESLESVMHEYKALCTEHQACCESVLGIHAYTEGDMSSAMNHLRTACMMGNTSACFNLGLCYETGSGVSKDLDKAKVYYSKAAQSGHKGALYNLGLIYLADAQPLAGLELVEKAAKAGLAQAQIYLGVHYMEETYDPVKAVLYFQAAAQQKDSEGQYFLGICLEQGWGVKQDLSRAVQLYSEAANTGHDMALYNLAVCYENGIGGLIKDPETAKDLYTKAALAGCEHASHRLEDIKADEKLQRFPPSPPTPEETQCKSPRMNNPLSPSASSPNLSLDWSLHPPLYKSSYKNMFDPGGCGRGGLSSLCGVDDIEKDIYTQTDSVLIDKSSLRRSYTSPNLALVACNV